MPDDPQQRMHVAMHGSESEHAIITHLTDEQKQDVSKQPLLLLFCAAGGRAHRAAEALRILGYQRVVNCGGIDDLRKVMEINRVS